MSFRRRNSTDQQPIRLLKRERAGRRTPRPPTLPLPVRPHCCECSDALRTRAGLGRLVELPNALPDLLTMDGDIRRGLDAQTNPVAADLQHRQGDVLVGNDDLLSTLP